MILQYIPIFKNTMTKLSIPVLAGVLGVWLVGGSLLFTRYSQHSKQKSLNTIPIREGSSAFTQLQSFYFLSGDSTANIPAPTIQQLKATVDHINEYPNKSIVLTGRLDQNESENNRKLGLLRAYSIKKVLVSLGAQENAVYLTSSITDMLNEQDNKIYDGVGFSIIESKKGNNLKNLNIYYAKNSYEFIRQPALDHYFTQLKNLISARPDLKICLTGWADTNENTTKKLATKRTEAIFRYLKSIDFPKSQIIPQIKKTMPEKSNPLNQKLELRIID
jgi:outer membrane protein OmpA-like peptidoglycan-associated protein